MRYRRRRTWAAAIAATALITTNSLWLAGNPPFSTTLRLALSAGSFALGLLVLLVGLRQARACATA